jgi:hypothetical protein
MIKRDYPNGLLLVSAKVRGDGIPLTRIAPQCIIAWYFGWIVLAWCRTITMPSNRLTAATSARHIYMFLVTVRTFWRRVGASYQHHAFTDLRPTYPLECETAG